MLKWLIHRETTSYLILYISKGTEKTDVYIAAQGIKIIVLTRKSTKLSSIGQII